MAIQSAVRCVETNPARPGEATAVRLDTAPRMDAIACIEALELELNHTPIGTIQKGMAGARLLRRTGVALVCTGLAVLIGGLAGTLGSF